MKDFRGKVAVITGAASGIGYGLAERCAQEGMNVVLAGINEDTLKKAEKDIKKTGATTLVVKTDVSKATDVETLAKKTLEKFGAFHLLFNNAGVHTFARVWESTLADWEWVLNVNLWGVIYGIHYFVPIMLKQNTECHIVNTSSSAGLTPSTYNSPYAVSKHGVVILTEALYNELSTMGNNNIGVSLLCPGFVRTNIKDCERNRPESLKNNPVEDPAAIDPNLQEITQKGIQLMERGISREKTADAVFSAIRDKKFYILINADMYKPMIKTRMEEILKRRNPTIVQAKFK